MVLKTVLEFDSNSRQEDVLASIAEILRYRMPHFMHMRTWVTLLINELSEDYYIDDPDKVSPKLSRTVDDAEVSLDAAWDGAFDVIVCNLNRAGDEIFELALQRSKEDSKV